MCGLGELLAENQDTRDHLTIAAMNTEKAIPLTVTKAGGQTVTRAGLVDQQIPDRMAT